MLKFSLFSCDFPNKKPSPALGFCFLPSTSIKLMTTSRLKTPRVAKPTIEDLAQAIQVIQGALANLAEKEKGFAEKLDTILHLTVNMAAQEARLKRLEDSLLTYLECATWVKATIRFWPVVVSAFLFLLGCQLY